MVLIKEQTNWSITRLDRTGLDPYKYGQSFSRKQRQFNGETIIFSKNGAGTTGHPCAPPKKNSYRHRPYTFDKN